MTPKSCIALASASFFAASAAQAQLVDDVAVRRQGNDTVLEFRFAVPVQLQRFVGTSDADLALIFYTLVGASQAEPHPPQGLRLGAKQGLPDVRVADEAERGVRNRRLVLRFAKPTQVAVRSGRGNRSIEVVLVGEAASVREPVAPAAAAASATPAVPAAPTQRATPAASAARAAPAATAPQAEPPAPPETEQRYVIALQYSEDLTQPLAPRIPSNLQGYDVHTAHRVVDNKTRQEVRVGYFATLAEAQHVLARLSGFPQAEIVALQPEAASAPVAQAAPTLPAAAPPSPPPAVAPAPAVPPPAAAATAPAPAAEAAAPTTELAQANEARAQALLAAARGALEKQDHAGALDALNTLLNLPPNRSTREAQELAGMTRLRAGDTERARAEFEAYLRQYPQGAGSDRVRRELVALGAAPAPSPAAQEAAPTPEREPKTVATGSASMYYYGGNGKVRSQDFQDSPINGLPQVTGDPLLSADHSRQLFNDVNLNWLYRDDAQDMRFVFRDSYTTDLVRSEKSKNRLSAAYLDYKSIPHGYSLRLGRQSPTGGGVIGRFDGAAANLVLQRKFKLGVIAGVPADPLFDTKRHFYSVLADVDGAVTGLGTGIYAIQQVIDGEIDRQAVGLELRYFRNGASVFSQLDYDTKIKGLNIANVQGTLVLEDNTVFNGLYDRRTLAMLALGNSLTFEDPANPGLFRRLAERLANSPIDLLREQVKHITPYVTQAQLGVTKPVTANWQLAGSAQLTNIGEIPPVAGVLGFENGRPATGNLYTVTGQVIGMNLYSPNDTQVLATSVISGPSYRGYLVSYNNSSLAWEIWQIEPSLQFFRDSTPQGSHSERWTPGLRLTYRGWKRWSIESAFTYELGRATRVTADPTDPTLTTTTQEDIHRVNYSLGTRYEF